MEDTDPIKQSLHSKQPPFGNRNLGVGELGQHFRRWLNHMHRTRTSSDRCGAPSSPLSSRQREDPTPSRPPFLLPRPCPSLPFRPLPLSRISPPASAPFSGPPSLRLSRCLPPARSRCISASLFPSLSLPLSKSDQRRRQQIQQKLVALRNGCQFLILALL